MGKLQDFYKVQKKEKKENFEKSLMSKDIVEYYSSKTKEELEKEFSTKVAKMVGFEQKNAHHCYDLWHHTLHTVKSVNTEGLSKADATLLKVAAFFHDIGKPDVVGYNPKTQQQNFFNHAIHSVDIAKDILTKIGYSSEEIQRISFYIAHHDDFISYKNTVSEKDNKHAFVRGINTNTIKEIIIQNQIDWKKLGIDCYLPTNTNNKKVNKNNSFQNTTNNIKKRYICSYLANGVKPEFVNFANQPISVDVDIDDIKDKISSGNYFAEYIPTEKDYKMLLEICKADANAQSEKIITINPETKEEIISDSRERKISTIEEIENVIDDAYREGMAIFEKKEVDKLADSIFDKETFNFNTTVENTISR
jgi:putative nucleotidyltransferase with HDIG domain